MNIKLGHLAFFAALTLYCSSSLAQSHEQLTDNSLDSFVNEFGIKPIGNETFTKKDLDSIANEFGIKSELLLAIAFRESGKGLGSGTNAVTPWPYTLRTPEGGFYYENITEAEKALTIALDRYGNKIDVGMFQISLAWHGDKVKTPYELLDPMINARIAADYLVTTLKSTNDPYLGVGRYHQWKDKTAAISYGKSVLSLAQKLQEPN